MLTRNMVAEAAAYSPVIVTDRDFLQLGRLLAADAIPGFKSLDVTYFFSMIEWLRKSITQCGSSGLPFSDNRERHRKIAT
jgi:hypothetical protein